MLNNEKKQEHVKSVPFFFSRVNMSYIFNKIMCLTQIYLSVETVFILFKKNKIKFLREVYIHLIVGN